MALCHDDCPHVLRHYKRVAEINTARQARHDAEIAAWEAGRQRDDDYNRREMDKGNYYLLSTKMRPLTPDYYWENHPQCPYRTWQAECSFMEAAHGQ